MLWGNQTLFAFLGPPLRGYGLLTHVPSARLCTCLARDGTKRQLYYPRIRAQLHTLVQACMDTSTHTCWKACTHVSWCAHHFSQSSLSLLVVSRGKRQKLAGTSFYKVRRRKINFSLQPELLYALFIYCTKPLFQSTDLFESAKLFTRFYSHCRRSPST